MGGEGSIAGMIIAKMRLNRKHFLALNGILIPGKRTNLPNLIMWNGHRKKKSVFSEN